METIAEIALTFQSIPEESFALPFNWILHQSSPIIGPTFMEENGVEQKTRY